MRIEELHPLDHGGLAHAPGKRATQLGPKLAKHSADEFRVRQQRDVPEALAAARRVFAGEQRPQLRGDLEIRLDLVAPLTARARPCAQHRHDLELIGARLGEDEHGTRIGIRDELEADRLEAQQQRIGADVVGAQRLRVEAPGVMLAGREVRAIEHQVAADVAQAPVAQRAQQQPEALEAELRIAHPLQHQVALQHTLLEGAVQVGVGPPAIRRPEHFEPCQRRDEFHHRSRIHRDGFVHAQRRGARLDGLHDRRGVRRRDAGGFQRLLDGRRPALRRLGACAEGNQRDYGKNVLAHGLDSMWEQNIVPRTRPKGLYPSGAALIISTR